MNNKYIISFDLANYSDQTVEQALKKISDEWTNYSDELKQIVAEVLSGTQKVQ